MNVLFFIFLNVGVSCSSLCRTTALVTSLPRSAILGFLRPRPSAVSTPCPLAVLEEWAHYSEYCNLEVHFCVDLKACFDFLYLSLGNMTCFLISFWIGSLFQHTTVPGLSNN